MKLETIKTPTTETFLEHKDFNVSVNTWSNGEGLNVMVTDKNLNIRLVAALRWDEVDALVATLAIARSN